MIAGCWLGGPFCLVYEDDEGALLGLSIICFMALRGRGNTGTPALFKRFILTPLKPECRNGTFKPRPLDVGELGWV
tara:strand:- start:896 stop:1123 length:228 start_codon:yes stop_codon:yes gene_type:complete